jgi:hypothetical protein
LQAEVQAFVLEVDRGEVHTSRPMAAEQLAYEEAKRAIDRQSNALDELRSRAGILLAAISLATSFLSGLALSGEDLSERAIIAVIAGGAIAAFLAAAGACVVVLWPPREAEWIFNLSARAIIGQLDATAPDEATVHRELALRHEADYDKNEERLKVLYWFLRAACIALAFEVFAWIVVFAL